MERLFIVAVLASLASAAVAATPDAQINFTGKVIDGTCTVTGTGSSPTVINVPLAQVHNSKFTVANAAINDGQATFNIALTNCPVTGTTTMKWDNSINVDAAAGTLKNTASGGTNAQIQLFKADGSTAINLATDPGVSFTGATQTYTYIAKYYAKAPLPVTAGNLATSTYIYLTYN